MVFVFLVIAYGQYLLWRFYKVNRLFRGTNKAPFSSCVSNFRNTS